MVVAPQSHPSLANTLLFNPNTPNLRLKTSGGWLVDWLRIGWFVCWLIGWFVCWLIGWIVCWLIGWIVGRSVVRLVAWLAGLLVDWLVCLLLDWSVFLLLDWLVSVSKRSKGAWVQSLLFYNALHLETQRLNVIHWGSGPSNSQILTAQS